MGFVSDAINGVEKGFGIGGGAGKGNKFQAQQSDLIQPATLEQANRAYANTASGLTQQQDFLNALQAQNGIQNQSNVFSEQQALANQLQGVANGTGPNPALQQLQNTTGQNVSNQAALMAGQRGASSNAGLLARQAAMQGANLQQQAVGQGAALSAQQQLAGMQALQGQQQLMGGTAAQQVGQTQGALSGYNQFSQQQQANVLNALGNYNNSKVSSASNANNANASIAGINAQAQNKFGAGVESDLFAGSSQLFGASGGEVPQVEVAPASSGGNISIPSVQEASSSDASPGGGSSLPTGAIMAMFAAKGGQIPSSHAGRYLKGLSLKQGGNVPGKASFQGNNYKNDTVPAMLSPGEVVIPRSVMQSKDPVEGSRRFVEAILKKKGMK